MEEEDTTTKYSIEYLLESFLLSKHDEHGNASFVHEPIEISAVPEEGVRLIRAFIRIKQPKIRAAIIKIATHIADGRALRTSVQN